MSYRLQDELETISKRWEPLGLSPAEIVLLHIIAKAAHHEDDPAHKGGKRRKAGSDTVGPRECFLMRDQLAIQMGISPDGVRKVCQRLQRHDLPVRIGKAGPGRAMVYRMPTLDQFWTAIAKAEQSRSGGDLNM